MRNTFKYTMLYLMRDRNILVWSLLFPVILSTLFSLMFAGFDENTYARDIELAVVEDSAWSSDANVVMREVVEAAASSGSASDGEGSLLALAYVPAETDAQALLSDAECNTVAYLVVNTSGAPRLVMRADATDSLLTGRQTIVKTLIDGAQRTKSALASGDVQPQAPPAVLAAASASFTESASLTRNAPAETVRYYYALLGMAAMFAATIGLVAMNRACANTSEVGARRALGATSRSRVMAATFAASWLLAFACLMVAFAYIRLVLGIGFGGKDAACVGALAASALMACALGMLVGALPSIPEAGKNGIMTGIACMSALFAGLYGQACMALADDIAAAAPWSVYVNPARLISQAFYALYYYDSFGPYLTSTGALVLIAVALLVATTLISRRQQHEHL